MNWDTELEKIAAKTKYPIGDGDHGSIKPSCYQTYGVPYIRVGDITWDGQLDKSKMVYIPQEVNELNPKSFLYPGDIVISKTGATIGKVAIIPDNIKIANTTASVGKVTLDNDLADSKYVLWCMKSHQFQTQLWRVSNKSAQPGFNVKDLKKFKIPLPPLDQQKKIADILDAANVYRQKTKALIEKYDKLTKSLFLDMFGDMLNSNDNLTTLEELCGKGKYGSGASATELKEGSPRYLRITDINEDGSLNDKIVSPDEVEIQYLLSKNDLVFARTGATVGKTYLYDEKDGELIYAGYLIKFKIPEPHNAKYFFQFTKTQKYKAWVNNQQNVVAQPNINAKQYGNELQIPLPPLELQNQFAERVEAIDKQKHQAQASLAQAEDLFNSLLQRVFKGELTS